MKHFPTIWSLKHEDRVQILTGDLECNISPQKVLEWCRNMEDVDPRHTVETYGHYLRHGKASFEKRYITKHGQWRQNALLQDRTLDEWPLEYVLSVVRGELGVITTPEEDDMRIKMALRAATSLPTDTIHPKDIIAYAQTYHSPTGPVMPRQTVRGNPVRSLRYMVLRPGEWTTSEQLDALDGNLSKHKEFDEDTVVESIRESLRLPMEWSRDEIYDFISNDVQPPKTSNGLWVNDVNRKYVILQHLTLEQMQAFFREEITLDFTKSDICKEYRLRRGLVDLSDMIIVNQVITMTQETTPSEVRFVTDMLEGFSSYMKQAGGKHPDIAAEAHHTMNALIGKVIRMPFVHYNEAMSIMLDYIYRNKTGIFAPHRVFGGITDVKFTPKQYAFYEQYMSLMLRTANPAERFHAAKNTSLVELVKVSPIGGDIGDKIRNFYKLDV